MTEDLGEDDCMAWGNPRSPCSGPVAYHSVDPGRATAVPRCEKHWHERLGRREDSIERWADSDVAPSWLDPAAAGERWDDDY